MSEQAATGRLRRERSSGIPVSALTSTLTSSAASFTAGGAGVTLTFTARDVDSNLIVGYTPVPESGVV
jgi:hypothetical protein